MPKNRLNMPSRANVHDRFNLNTEYFVDLDSRKIKLRQNKGFPFRHYLYFQIVKYIDELQKRKSHWLCKGLIDTSP